MMKQKSYLKRKMSLVLFCLLNIEILHASSLPINELGPRWGYSNFGKRHERSVKEVSSYEVLDDVSLTTITTPFEDIVSSTTAAESDLTRPIMKDEVSSIKKRPGAVLLLSSSMSHESSSVRKRPGAEPLPDKLSSIRKRPGAMPALQSSMPEKISSVRKRPGVQPDPMDPDEFGAEAMSINGINDPLSQKLSDTKHFDGLFTTDEVPFKSFYTINDRKRPTIDDTNHFMKSSTYSADAGIESIEHQKESSKSTSIHQQPPTTQVMENYNNMNSLPSTSPSSASYVQILKPNNVTSHLPEQMMGVDINKGTVMRMLVVLLGSTFIVVLYFGIKSIRLRRSSRVQKYGLLSNKSSGNDYELSPLDFDDDDDEDEDDDDQHTLFSKNRP